MMYMTHEIHTDIYEIFGSTDEKKPTDNEY